MTDPFTFDLNNEEKFPVLHGISEYLNGFMPRMDWDFYWRKWDSGTNRKEETLEETKKDKNKLIEIIKSSIFRIKIASGTSDYFDKLIEERDYLFAINIPGKDQRDNNINSYNRYVIEKVKSYCYFIEDTLQRTFYGDPMKSEIEKLNVKQLFSFWFEKFEMKNESEKIESLPPDTIKIKLQWRGTPGEFGAIFDKLFDNGFIEVIKDKKSMVRVLHSIFEVKNEKDEIVDAEYLYKCFKDKKRSYPEGQLTIPFSDNYNKSKFKKPL